MRRLAAALVAACLCCLPVSLAGRPEPRQAEPSRDWFIELDTWLSAVDGHEPGKADAAAEAIAPWSQDRLSRMLGDVLELRKRMGVYRDRPKAEIRLRLRRLQPADIEQLFRISGEERLAVDLNRVIRRGAVLHADIAMLARDLPVASADGGITVRLSDARQWSVGPETSHWGFGRDLVAALRHDEASERFTSDWYLGTAAHMQVERMLTKADQHLAQARRALPGDPEILFAGACALETLASRKVQTELSTLAAPPGYVFDDRPVRVLEDEAISLFRKALDRGLERPEARIRMGRLVGVRGDHPRAAAELQRALTGLGDRTLNYFGWLFLGDEFLALGDEGACRLRV